MFQLIYMYTSSQFAIDIGQYVTLVGSGVVLAIVGSVGALLALNFLC